MIKSRVLTPSTCILRARAMSGVTGAASAACFSRHVAGFSTRCTEAQANRRAYARREISPAIFRRSVRCAADGGSSSPTPQIEANFDETFCIVDRGCEHVLRRLTPSQADVSSLDRLLRTVQFETNSEEWLALLKNNVDPADSSLNQTHSIDATGVFDENETLVGVCTSVTYQSCGRSFGHLGNIVVDETYRKKGVASMLLTNALFSLREKKVFISWLDASAMGQPLYRKMGFEPRSEVVEYRKEIHSGVTGTDGVTDDVDPCVRDDPRYAEDLAFAKSLDTTVFGADRTALLDAWRTASPGFSFCHVGDKKTGYALAHTRGDAVYLGPWGLVDGDDIRGVNENEIVKFIDDAIGEVEEKALRTLGVRKLIAYVPVSIIRGSAGVLAGTDDTPAVDTSAPAFHAARVMAEALERIGFVASEATTRMARVERNVPTEAQPELRLKEPGYPDRTLTVASLDLG